jgi:hypothetical protein
MSAPSYKPSAVDVPSLSVRWEGLVVVIDEQTINTVLHRATRRVPEVSGILVEADGGVLSLTIKVKKGFRFPLRSRITSIRFRDGWLGFALAELKVFGFIPIPPWVVKRIVDRQPPGFAFFYPSERVVVLNLSTVLPPELSLEVQDVRCENGEIRVAFGPSRLRLDRLVETLDRDPFDLD